MWYMILVQIIGGIAYAVLSFSYYKKDKKNILFLQILAYILFTIHYFMLSGITGAICNIIGLVSLILLYILDKKKAAVKVFVVCLTVIALVVINALTFQNIFSIFPIIASSIAVLSFLNKNENVIRGIGVVAAVCWLAYAVYYQSYISIVFEAVTLLNVFTAFIKNANKEVLK